MKQQMEYVLNVSHSTENWATTRWYFAFISMYDSLFAFGQQKNKTKRRRIKSEKKELWNGEFPKLIKTS